jgi:hypothetical protein
MQAGLDLIITRHAATADWIARSLAPQQRRIVRLQHLSPGFLSRPHWNGRRVNWSGARFFGVIPLWLAADICAHGAECWIANLYMPRPWRGADLPQGPLDRLHPVLVQYRVIALHPIQAGQNTQHNSFQSRQNKAGEGCGREKNLCRV